MGQMTMHDYNGLTQI